MSDQHVEFGQTPFFMGSLTGTRAWQILTNGHLAGIFIPRPWTPDENFAVCDNAPGSCSGTAFGMYAYLYHSAAQVKVPHKVGGLEGRCGFYAYYDGSNVYDGHSRVSGIIEGYGTVTFGSKGFRSSKAKILALVTPRQENYASMVTVAPVDKVMEIYPEIPWFDSMEEALEEFPLSRPEDYR